MKTSYKFDSTGFIQTNSSDSSLTIFRDLTDEEENEFLAQYALPHDVFYFDQIKPIAPRYERIQNELLGDTRILVLSNITPSKISSNVEDRLESHVYILGEKHLYWFIKDGHSHFDYELTEAYPQNNVQLQSMIMYAALLSFTHFTQELSYQKEQIDFLNKQADKRTSNEILTQVTDTERNLVILEHTINTQKNAIRRLLKDNDFINLLDDSMLVHDVKWYNNQVNNLVHVYRDLFDAVSSLYSDIVSNNLNRLMKFLSSLSIILASTSLIAEFWGMNTGGLLFENHELGTLYMILVAIIAGTLMYLYLKSRNFFDD